MNVKIARIKMGLTQKQLAKKAGISPVTLVRIEKGNIESIRLKTLKAIAKVLNSNIEELFLN
ncbi:helix-turn-helix transcriptional regulator [Clostridium sporogenes]|uniref:helix-turn-helix transcriptional regulator n=1 Tax=Clostridium sporogenes TaxID=1509 RepID=UPI0006B289C5|nr:helix-turn-helix transcriptional regulator [Clostridium sporogenes]KOY67270.1 transcriptional regulator [Clostridium sporogenes]